MSNIYTQWMLNIVDMEYLKFSVFTENVSSHLCVLDGELYETKRHAHPNTTETWQA